MQGCERRAGYREVVGGARVAPDVMLLAALVLANGNGSGSGSRLIMDMQF